MKLVVTGAAGLLGTAVVDEARARGMDVTALHRTDLDVTDEGGCRPSVTSPAPDVVVHCAAYTDVDGAEEHEDLARDVNVRGARNVARAALEAGATLVYPGTDYVFDGAKGCPYLVDDPPAPLSAYGRSKLAGEEAVRASGAEHLIVRTSWLYGAGGRNFVDTIRTLAETRDEIPVVSDQRSRPTWSVSLARTLLDLLHVGARGTVHACDDGTASWLEVAEAVIRTCGLTIRVRPVSSVEWGADATRPADSTLDLEATRALLPRPLPHWRSSLETYLEDSP